MRIAGCSSALQVVDRQACRPACRRVPCGGAHGGERDVALPGATRPEARTLQPRPQFGRAGGVRAQDNAPWRVVPVTCQTKVRLQQCLDRSWVGVGFAIVGCTVFGGECDQRALLAVVGWIGHVTQDDNGQLSDLHILPPGCSNVLLSGPVAANPLALEPAQKRRIRMRPETQVLVTFSSCIVRGGNSAMNLAGSKPFFDKHIDSGLSLGSVTDMIMPNARPEEVAHLTFTKVRAFRPCKTVGLNAQTFRISQPQARWIGGLGSPAQHGGFTASFPGGHPPAPEMQERTPVPGLERPLAAAPRARPFRTITVVNPPSTHASPNSARPALVGSAHWRSLRSLQLAVAVYRRVPLCRMPEVSKELSSECGGVRIGSACG